MKQRARRSEDKAERVGAILAAAREVWAESASNDLSVSAVAERAGIVKGTIYIYFPTREDLVLALFECLFHEYVDDVERTLAARRGRWPADGVADALAKPLRKHRALLPLLALTGTSGIARQRLEKTASLPAIRDRGGLPFLLRAHALLTGLAATDFPHLESEFRDSLSAMLHGMEKRK